MGEKMKDYRKKERMNWNPVIVPHATDLLLEYSTKQNIALLHLII
jgi:hypothetical protein